MILLKSADLAVIFFINAAIGYRFLVIGVMITARHLENCYPREAAMQMFVTVFILMRISTMTI